MDLLRAPSKFGLRQSATPLAAHTGTTSETILWTLSFQAGEIPAGSIGEIETYFSNITNDASAKTAQIRIGAAGAGTGGTLLQQPSLASIATYNSRAIILFESASVQSCLLNNGGVGGAAAAITTAAINTAAAWEIVISLTLADGTDSITPRGYRLTWSKP